MSRRRPRQSSLRGGFTLVEILVVLVILAIAVSVAIPYVTGTSDVQAIAAARIIASDLQYAQNVAVTTQSPVTVTFDTNSDSYTLSNASGPLVHPMTKEAYTVLLASQRGFDRVDLAGASFGGGPAVTFDELGSPSAAGVVTLRAGQYEYQISVASATGKVTVAASGS